MNTKPELKPTFAPTYKCALYKKVSTDKDDLCYPVEKKL